MKPTEPEALTMVVEDSFRIQRRGWVLAPALAMDRFPANGRLAIDVVEPGGTTRSLSGRFMIEHLRLADGRSKWDGVIVIDESAARVPPGSRLTCRLEGSHGRRPVSS